MRRNVTQTTTQAIQIPKAENNRSDSSVELNALAQSHPKMKYKGGVLLILS